MVSKSVVDWRVFPDNCGKFRALLKMDPIKLAENVVRLPDIFQDIASEHISMEDQKIVQKHQQAAWQRSSKCGFGASIMHVFSVHGDRGPVAAVMLGLRFGQSWTPLLGGSVEEYDSDALAAARREELEERLGVPKAAAQLTGDVHASIAYQGEKSYAHLIFMEVAGGVRETECVRNEAAELTKRAQQANAVRVILLAAKDRLSPNNLDELRKGLSEHSVLDAAASRAARGQPFELQPVLESIAEFSTLFSQEQNESRAFTACLTAIARGATPTNDAAIDVVLTSVERFTEASEFKMITVPEIQDKIKKEETIDGHPISSFAMPPMEALLSQVGNAV